MMGERCGKTENRQREGGGKKRDRKKERKGNGGQSIEVVTSSFDLKLGEERR